MDPERKIGRATFLGIIGTGVAGILFGNQVSKFLSGGIPNGLKSVLPFGDGWRIYTVASVMPTFDRTTYQLEVAGLVDKPLTLSYDDIRSRKASHMTKDFHCVTGWSVSGVKWKGIRLSDLLDEAGVKSSASVIRFISAEIPYVDTLTLDQARGSDIMLAYEMDGKPLTQPHGSPLRLVIPKMYGYKGVKWVRRIEVVSQSDPGFWEQRGYDRDAWIGHSNGL
jgi:DMSO/TMAO reductase YedYZ molybdopterin-dependent catalytic subunit